MKHSVWTLVTLALLPLALSACGGGGTSAPAPKTDFTQPSSVEGTVQGFSGGGTLQLNDSDEKTVASASADSSGNFKLFLPSKAASTNLTANSLGLAFLGVANSDGTCTGSISSSDVAAKIYAFDTLVLIQGKTKLNLRSGSIQSSKDSDGERKEYTLTSWVYSDTPYSLVGNRTCTSSSVEAGKTVVTTRLTQMATYLKSGWNTVTARVSIKSGSSRRAEIEVRSVDTSKSVWQEIDFYSVFESTVQSSKPQP